MKNSSTLILLIVLLFICETTISQINNSKPYIIFTFELKKGNSKYKDLYYWISPLDSIDKKISFNIFPLYTEEFSKDNLDRCIKGDSVDIFTSTTSTSYRFDEDYESRIKQLVTLIENKRTKIQTSTLKWVNNERVKEKITIYATPIIGEFCNCVQLHEIGGSHEFEFIALAYMPVSSFSFDGMF